VLITSAFEAWWTEEVLSFDMQVLLVPRYPGTQRLFVQRRGAYHALSFLLQGRHMAYRVDWEVSLADSHPHPVA
jgi:hypothetical protein